MINVPLLSVIIPTTGKPKRKLLLKKIFSKVKEEKIKEKIEIILVENSDYTRHSCIFLVNDFPDLDIRYYKLGQKSASLARNFGIKKSRGKFLVFLDDDCIPRKVWFKTLEKLIPPPPDVTFQGKIVPRFEERNIWINVFNAVNAVVEKENKTGELTPFFNIGNVLVRKDSLEKLEYIFDEKLFPYVGEQEDLAYRLRGKGVDILYNSRLVVDHIKEKKTFFSSLKRSFLYGRRDGILRNKYKLGTKIEKLERIIGKGLIKTTKEDKRRKMIRSLRRVVSRLPFLYRVKFFLAFSLTQISFKIGFLYGKTFYRFCSIREDENN